MKRKILTTLFALLLTTTMSANVYAMDYDDDSSDATEIEFCEEHRNGFIEPEEWGSSYGSLAGYGAQVYAVPPEVLPSSFDIRDLYTIPAIRDQGLFGTCWAHAAVACMEINLIKKGLADGNINLSELQVSFFSYYSAPDPLGLTDGEKYEFPYNVDCFLCRGGNSQRVMKAMSEGVTIFDENKEPELSYGNALKYHNYVRPLYDPGPAKCEITRLNDSYAYSNGQVRIVGYAELDKSDRTTMKKAIMEYGAVQASYCDNTEYSFDHKCVFCPEVAKTNHAIAVVGWDDNFSKDNFLTPANVKPKSDGAWICRNSWGKNIGYSGYFYISYEDVTMGYPCVFDVELAEKDSNIYFYDRQIADGYMLSSSKSGNRYVAKGNDSGYERIYAVGAWVSSYASGDVTFDVYTDLQDLEDLESGLNKQSVQVHVDNPNGLADKSVYVYAQLKNPIDIEEGKYFSVVYNSSADNLLRRNYGSNPEESYWKGNRGYTDLNTIGEYSRNATNSCLKVYTKDVDGSIDKSKCQIEYVLNGGDNSDLNADSAARGSRLTLGSPSREKYSFDGWYLDSRFVNKATFPYTVSDNTVFYAKWTPEKYRLTYVLDGGKNSRYNPDYIDKSASILNLKEATKSGALMDGWYLDAGFKDIVPDSYEVTKDTTFYAKWDINKFTYSHWCRLEKEDGTYGWNKFTSGELKGGTICRLIDYKFDGYVLDGWYTDENFTDRIESDRITITANTTVYAKYELKRFLISYELDGGVNNESNPSSVGVNHKNLLLGIPTKDGYVFDGWFTDSAFTQKVEDNIFEVTDNVTFWAKWRLPQDLTISYELGGGINSPLNPTKVSELSPVITLLNPTKKYYRFVGWYTDSLYSKRIAEPFTVTGDVTLYAKWENYTVNVSYIRIASYGDVPAASYAISAGEYALLDESSLNIELGCELDGFYTNRAFTDKFEPGSKYEFEEDTTFYYVEAPKTYTIRYELDGGTNSLDNPTSYVHGVGVTSFKAPTKAGYRFAGWYYLSEGVAYDVVNIPSFDHRDYVLYAKWSPNQYYITYHGCMSSNPNPYSYKTGEGFELKPLSCEGYTFDGWYEDSNYNKMISSIDSSRFGDIVIYAKWISNIYSISYELYGGVNSEKNPISYAFGEGVDEFFIPTKDHYLFMGWFKEAEFVNQINYIESSAMGDLQLHAKWEAMDYYIDFITNGGGLPEGTPTQFKYGVGIPSFATPVKIGYTFNGWFSEPELTNEITSISITQAEDVTLYAKWTANTYNITYELDGGTNDSDNPAIIEFDSGAVTLKNPTKDGYRFVGWFDSAVGGNKVSIISDRYADDITLYARWVEENTEYTVDYYVRNGLGFELYQSLSLQSLSNSSMIPANRTGYTFDGWYYDEAFTNKLSDDEVVLSGNINVYGRFVANVYAVNYVLGGGSNSSKNPSRYTYGVGVSSFADATRTGYKFLGWYKDAKFSGKVTSIGKTSTGAVTLYAKWQKKAPYTKEYVVSKATYKVKYSADDKITDVIFVKTADKKAKSITIDTVKIEKKTVKVTAIADNALKNNSTVTKLTIGSGVKSIGKNAFYNCKKLKSVVIKTTALTDKSVGKNSFKGLDSKAVIKVPAKKLAEYTKLLKKKGLTGKNQKVKK